MRLVQETYHDCQGEEALTYLYESNSYVPLARIDQGKAAATVSARFRRGANRKRFG